MPDILRSRLTQGVLLGVLLSLGVIGAFSLYRFYRPPSSAQADDGKSRGDIHIKLTKLKFDGPVVTLLKRDGIEIRAACIGSFDITGISGGDRPGAGYNVARMFFKNVSASNASAAVGGADLDFGLTTEGPDYGDRHTFGIGEELNIAVADCPGGGCGVGDLAGAQGPGGSMGFVYQSNGRALVVLHALAAVNLLGADCAFAARVDVSPDHD